MKETVTKMLTGCLGLIESDHICMLVTKIGFKLEIKMWDSVYLSLLIRYKFLLLTFLVLAPERVFLKSIHQFYWIKLRNTCYQFL